MQRRPAPHVLWLVVAIGVLGACDESSAAEGDAATPDAMTAHDASASADADADADAAVAVPCDVVAPTACTNPDSSFKDVQPIVQRRCLSCHDGKTEQWPLIDYAHVAAWFNEIRGSMLTCSMPPPASGLMMPTEEREAVLMWLRCGFPP